MGNSPRRKRRSPKVLYSRELPGGGYVSILTELTDDSSFRGWIAVERRSDLHRRDGDASPVIAEMQADNADSIYVSLHRIASDNVAVAREIRRWEARRAGER